MKKIVLLILICMFITGCGSDSGMSSNSINAISVEEVKSIVDSFNDQENVVIIDVRTNEEYKEGHIKNSINIPVDNIEKINYRKDTKIILYCRSGNRSNQAALKLKNLGYENIYDMGGINYWTYDLE